MGAKRNDVEITEIEQGRPFRAKLGWCDETGDYIKIGDRVLLVIATVAHENNQPFHVFEYIPVGDVRHINPDLDEAIYAGENEGSAEEWR